MKIAALALAWVFSAWLALCGVVSAAELTLAADGKSDYQIVLPEKTLDPIIDRALAKAADVMREMFHANGCAVPVVKESQANKQQPGIYLGDTAVARADGARRFPASRTMTWPGREARIASSSAIRLMRSSASASPGD